MCKWKGLMLQRFWVAMVLTSILAGVQMGCPQDDDGEPERPCSGDAETFNGGELVTLDGSRSFDPNSVPLTFQWAQLSGTPVTLSDPTAVITTFTAPGVDDVLTFELTVTNLFGLSDACVATVIIQCPLPTILQEPIDQVVCPGDTAIFSVAATGLGTLTYQWRRGAVNLVDGGDISGAATPTLMIANAEAGDAATDYNCVVTGLCGSVTSNNASLSLNESTVITQQPADQTVCPGQTATFTVAATGAGTLAYQWRRGAVNLADGGDISGATTPTLAIANAEAADAATDYNCVVTGLCGSVTSNNASLSLNESTVITQHPANQTVCPGEPATFTVAATGAGVLTYQWRRGAVNLADGGDISGATTATLAIANVDAGDVRTDYNCVVTGLCGSVTSNDASLTMGEPTQIIQDPQSRTFVEGETITFTVVATGQGTLTFQWQYDDGDTGFQDIVDGGRFSGATTDTLQIENVDVIDAGQYRCVVTGDCGTAISAPASLTQAPG